MPKNHVIFVFGSVLIIISALLLIFDSNNIPSSAYNEEELSNNTYDILNEIDEKTQEQDIQDDFFTDYDHLNLIFSKEDSLSLKNLKYSLKEGEVRWENNKLVINGEIEKNQKNQKIILRIPRGYTGSEISALLADKNLINDKQKFIDLLLKLDIDKKLMAGEYNFEPDPTAVDILLTIVAP